MSYAKIPSGTLEEEALHEETDSPRPTRRESLEEKDSNPSRYPSTRYTFEEMEDNEEVYSQESPSTHPPKLRKTALGKSEFSILDICSENEEQKKQGKEMIKNGVAFAKENTPGFFTPFRSKKEFGITATSPLVSPLVFGLIAGGALLAAALGTLTAAGSLIVAGGAGLYGLRNDNAKATATSALGLSALAGIVAAAGALVAAAAAVLAVVLAPIATVYLLTRSAATGVAKINDCISSCGSKEESYLAPRTM